MGMMKNKFVKAVFVTATFGLLSFTIAKFSLEKNQIVLDIVMSGLITHIIVRKQLMINSLKNYSIII
jgi:hypothetical protein